MNKELYESPQLNLLQYETDGCILEGSVITGQDYNPGQWLW